MHFSHFSWYCIFLRIVYLLQIPVFIKNWQFVSYKNKWEIYFNSINFQKYLNSSSEEYHWSAVKWGIETNCKQNGSLGHQLLQWAFSSFCLRTTSVLGSHIHQHCLPIFHGSDLQMIEKKWWIRYSSREIFISEVSEILPEDINIITNLMQEPGTKGSYFSSWELCSPSRKYSSICLYAKLALPL